MSALIPSVPPSSVIVPVDPNLLTIKVNGVIVSGFDTCEINAGIEEFPRNFRVNTTEKYLSGNAIEFVPLQPCQVYIGTDLIITGFIDAYNISISPDSHSVTILGRGNGARLVDCSAFVNPGDTLMQSTGTSSNAPFVGDTVIANVNIQQVCQVLCKPYGITVSSPTPGLVTQTILPMHITNLGETIYDTLETCARYAGALLYDDTGGNLVLAQAGTQSHSSGFDYNNVQAISVSIDWSQRYSDYIPLYFPSDTNSDEGITDLASVPVQDSQVTLFRPLVVISEQVSVGSANQQQRIATQRATWEMKRRRGRSEVINLTTDNWRDSSGVLWTPNFLVSINHPAAKVNGIFLISKVSYKKGLGGGTTCDLELMTADAFAIEPISNVNEISDILANMNTTNSTTNATVTPPAATPTNPVIPDTSDTAGGTGGTVDPATGIPNAANQFPLGGF